MTNLPSFLEQIVDCHSALYYLAVLQDDVVRDIAYGERLDEGGVPLHGVADVGEVLGVAVFQRAAALLRAAVHADGEDVVGERLVRVERGGAVALGDVAAAHGELAEGVLAVVVPRSPDADNGAAAVQLVVVDHLAVDVLG